MAMPRVVEFDADTMEKIRSHRFELEFSLERVTGGNFRLTIAQESPASGETLFDQVLPTNNKRYAISDLLFALREVFASPVLLDLVARLNLYHKAGTSAHAPRSGAA